MIKHIQQLAVLVGIIALVLGVNYAVASSVWNPRPSSPPTNNADAPLNVSANVQEKQGVLRVTGFRSLFDAIFDTTLKVTSNPSLPIPAGMKVLADGNIGADKYCNKDGTVCVDANGLTGGSGGTTSSDGLVPAGAVLPFDLAACPTGWSAYGAAAGRNIIGTNVAHARGSTGGEEKHIQTLAELVAHTHDVTSANAGGRAKAGPDVSGINGTEQRTSTVAGGGQAFNIMDPYVALLYCKKN